MITSGFIYHFDGHIGKVSVDTYVYSSMTYKDNTSDNSQLASS